MLDAQLSFQPTTTSVSLSPPVRLQALDCGSRQVFVARDDLLPGGTKQRACAPFLRQLADLGYRHFYYASPFAGFAQVALSYVCAQLGLECHLYCERDQTARQGPPQKHEFTKLAESFGAKIHLTESLEAADRLATREGQKSPQSSVVPLGFNCDAFKDALEFELKKQWRTITDGPLGTPKRLWIPVGSGTLASVFNRVIGPETEILAVNVRVLKSIDVRIQRIAKDPRMTLFSAPEEFHDGADLPPRIPSNLHYDAKLWQFLLKYAEDGDLWWNVAR